jgi:hypothetical protein
MAAAAEPPELLVAVAPAVATVVKPTFLSVATAPLEAILLALETRVAIGCPGFGCSGAARWP